MPESSSRYQGSHDNMCGVPNTGGCFVPWCTCLCHSEARWAARGSEEDR